ncbi:MAG: translocation/assembly module TamB domain-containing protein [Schwartzia sp.]|nr:translocation/assembly module TamB domain-containing protein [Schwartzia sp. (in: firmicutes)]
MTRRSWMIAAGGTLGLLFAVCAFFWVLAGTQSFMTDMGRLAGEKGSEILGTRLEVGEVSVDSPCSLTVRDIALYDKRDELLARAESATARFSLFGMITKKPAEAVEEVLVRRPEAWVAKRADGSWNYQDLLEEESEPSGFRGTVRSEYGAVELSMDGKKLQVSDINGGLDFADAQSTAFDAKARCGTAALSVEGTAGNDGSATLDVEGSDVELEAFLEWIPEGTLPDSVQIRGGRVKALTASVEKRGEAISCRGNAEFSGGAVRVLETEIRGIEGTAEFTERAVTLAAKAEAEGQEASVRGCVDFSGSEPRLSLLAQSEAFDPGEVMKDIPFHGPVAFSARVGGTVSSPVVSGEFRAAEGTAAEFAFRDAKAQASYADGRVTVRSLAAEMFGGHVEAEGEFDAPTMAFDGHAMLTEVDAAQFEEIVPGLAGRASADLGFAGNLEAPEAVSVYGSATGHDFTYLDIFAPEFSVSFYHDAEKTKIDYLSLHLENDGAVGLEGTVLGMDALNLAFFATHVDLSLLSRIDPMLDMEGFGDANGTVCGPMENPSVAADFAAIRGRLFKQPFRTLHGTASGNLDSVRIDSFSMENGGKVNWLAKGVVGLTGARRVDLQIDTVGARLEDIAAYIAPDLPITGDIDNIITVTGTLDNPSVVGYVSSHRGSYNGYLLSGMEGDYTVKDGVLALQDFHIYSPLIDMDLNGTVTVATRALELAVEVHDIDLRRFEKKLPYPIEGHGVFDGHIFGTLDDPVFDGKLTAKALALNGETITDAAGEVHFKGSQLELNPFSFRQNGGVYSLRLAGNLADERLSGKIKVEQGDLGAMLSVANLKNEAVHGRMDAEIEIGGTMAVPRVAVRGVLTEGDVRGYPLTGVSLDATLLGRVVTLRRFEGHQGGGTLAAVGTVDLDGEIDARISAQKIQAGLLSAAAGLNVEAVGTLDVEAQFGGTVEHPLADASLTILNGGVRGSTFDSLTGLLHLRGSVVELEQLVATKAEGAKTYRASASGMLPLKAFTAQPGDELSEYDRINLRLSLDDADLGLLPLLSNEIEWAMGETDGNVVIGGSLAAPTFDGAFRIKNGSMKLKSLKIPVTEMNLGLLMEGDTISIEEGASGRMGKGSVRIGGSTRLDGQTPVDYHLNVDADKLEIASSFLTGPVTASIDLREGTIYGHRLPKLTGRLAVDDVLVSVPSIPDSEGELPNLILDFGLEIGKHTHFYSAGLYDLWLQGSAHFGGTTRHPQQSGTISVRRGRVQYLQTSFRVTEGEAYFNQVDSFLPSVTFKATARMNRTRIMLGIDGPVQQMKFTLTSSPEMSQQEILRLLTFRGASTQGGSQDSAEAQRNALLMAGLQMSVLGEVQNAIRDLLQLDELTFSTGTFEKGEKGADKQSIEAYNVQIGKYVTDKIMLRYTQSLSEDMRRYGVRYDFTDRFSAFALHDDKNRTWFGLEARFSF